MHNSSLVNMQKVAFISYELQQALPIPQSTENLKLYYMEKNYCQNFLIFDYFLKQGKKIFYFLMS